MAKEKKTTSFERMQHLQEQQASFATKFIAIARSFVVHMYLVLTFGETRVFWRFS